MEKKKTLKLYIVGTENVVIVMV